MRNGLFVLSVLLMLTVSAAQGCNQHNGHTDDSPSVRPPGGNDGSEKELVSSERSTDQPRLVAQTGYRQPVTTAAFSPDGKYVLTLGTKERPIVWEVRTGRQVRAFPQSDWAALSPNGQFVLTGYSQNAEGVQSAPKPLAAVWSIDSGEQLSALKGNPMGFTPNGDVLTWEHDVDQGLRRWSGETGELIKGFGGESVNGAVLSPDGRSVLNRYWYRYGGSEGRPRMSLWSVETGKEVWNLQDDAGHWSKPSDIATFSPDGQHVVTGHSNISVLRPVATGKELHTFKGTPARFSPDSRYVLTYEGAKVHRWSVASGDSAGSFDHDNRLESVTFSPDGKRLLTAGTDPARRHPVSEGYDQTVRMWSVATGRQEQSFGKESESVAFSPDGRHVLVGDGGGTARLIAVEPRRLVQVFEGHGSPVASAAFSPDGRYVVTGSDTKWDLKSKTAVKLWSLESGSEVGSFAGHPEHGYVEYVAFSPDSTRLLVGDGDRARLWSVKSGELEREFGGKHIERGQELKVSEAAFSPDGQSIVGGTFGKTARIWSVETGTELKKKFEGHTSSLESVAFSPDGKHVLTGASPDDMTARLWSVESGKQEMVFNGHKWYVNAVAFSPDGRHILTGGSSDATARLWDPDSGNNLHILQHNDHVTSVAFSPDSRFAATGCGDSTATLWEVDSGKKVRVFAGHGDAVNSVAFSPDADGKYLLTGSSDMTTRLWETASGRELARLISLNDGTWVVVTPEGRFDTNNLERITGVHWIMPDEPRTPLPLEIFMRDYYEPRLLPRVLAGDKLPALPDLSQLNRVQPAVSITSVASHQGDPERVDVYVQVESTSRTLQSVSVESGARDLYLFRDGQLVGLLEGDLLATGGNKTFERIRLPLTGATVVQFSAYAFNTDRVKSDTARETYQLPAGLAPRKGRAYVISVGVNRYDAPRWNLKFAVNDARAIQQTLHASLTSLGEYQSVVQVPLYSDEEQRLATKTDFKAVIDLLAGRTVDSAQRARIPSANEIREAHPEDLVLFSFSGHGYAGDGKLGARGAFYFLLSDIGENAKVTKKLLARTVSSEELTEWLRAVDAGDLAFIIDACHSASSVEGEGFKPGPMGSRGLGQLAYNKGMLILAASQADDVAFEDNKLQHGFLTYSLAQEGLDGFMADREEDADGQISLAEWLDYGVRRVPDLYEEVRSGEHKVLELKARDLELELEDGEGPVSAAQQPSLFNFRRRTPLVIGDK